MLCVDFEAWAIEFDNKINICGFLYNFTIKVIFVVFRSTYHYIGGILVRLPATSLVACLFIDCMCINGTVYTFSEIYV